MSSQPRLPIAASHSFRGLTILVVEDHCDSRELLVTLLEGYGATVLAAETAGSGFDLLTRHQPDIIVSDIGLPDEDGNGLLRRVRRLHEAEGGAIPAIALTAYATAEDRRAALAAGFDDFLTKPVEVTRLIEAIDQLARGPSSSIR
jgi:CheY-like chemotaxis protein